MERDETKKLYPCKLIGGPCIRFRLLRKMCGARTIVNPYGCRRATRKINNELRKNAGNKDVIYPAKPVNPHTVEGSTHRGNLHIPVARIRVNCGNITRK